MNSVVGATEFSRPANEVPERRMKNSKGQPFSPAWRRATAFRPAAVAACCVYAASTSASLRTGFGMAFGVATVHWLVRSNSSRTHSMKACTRADR